MRATLARPRDAGPRAAPPGGAGVGPGSPLPPVLAVAHGSSDPRAATVVEGLVAAAQAASPDLRARAAFLDHTAPPVLAALAELAAGGAREVVVLPLLLTAAYHTRVDIPRELATARERLPDLRVHYAAALGPHPLLLAGLERRLGEAGVVVGDPDTAVVLAAAGSSDPAAIATIEGLAAGWRARGWWDVQPAYASATGPDAGEAVHALRRRGAPRVAVAPYVIGPGLLPDRIAAGARAAGADAVTDVLGVAPEVVEVLLARAREAVPAPPPRAAA